MRETEYFKWKVYYNWKRNVSKVSNWGKEGEKSNERREKKKRLNGLYKILNNIKLYLIITLLNNEHKFIEEVLSLWDIKTKRQKFLGAIFKVAELFQGNVLIKFWNSLAFMNNEQV